MNDIPAEIFNAMKAHLALSGRQLSDEQIANYMRETRANVWLIRDALEGRSASSLGTSQVMELQELTGIERSKFAIALLTLQELERHAP